MILFLSRNESVNLFDRAAGERSLHIRKMSGNFDLSEFIIRDMRKYASCRYFCVERLAINENDDDFWEALKSFQMMYSARVIVLYESASEIDSFTRGLVQIGVTDIVTAPDINEKLAQIAECLSAEGMTKYKPAAVRKREPNEPDEEKTTLAQNIVLKEMEDEQYRFDCVNVNIGIIGATRRVGTTSLALGLAGFIKNHGGTACYAAFNTNGHLESIASSYSFDTEEDFYTYDAVDYYECMMPKHDYNFVIYDYGDMQRDNIRKFKESHVHLLCGASGKKFEVLEFAEALKQVKSVNPRIFTNTPNPKYEQLFNSAVSNEPTIIKPVGNMLDWKVNGIVYKQIVQPFIVETSKRL